MLATLFQSETFSFVSIQCQVTQCFEQLKYAPYRRKKHLF